MQSKRFILLIMMISFCTLARAQKIALKNNLLMDGMASPNLGVEFKVGVRTTLDVPVSWNLWSFRNDKKFKHFAVQPELRWWKCQPFTGHFLGVHAHYASYNAGGIGPFRTIKDHRYEGWLAGVGVSYGYNWIFAPRWSLEATVGAGYAYMSHDKFPCGKCKPKIGHKTAHYFGLTKLGLTLVFLIK